MVSGNEFQVRRATVDDLPGLTALWATMHFSTQELEPRLTEFQVVQAEDGRLLGALGLEISGRHGRLHSEGFTDFALSDRLRQGLWERMQSVAGNHGLVRVWTQETAPFWRQNGLHPADAGEAAKLPPAWSVLPPNWLTLQLRDEAALEMSLDKEFARFKELEMAETAKAMRTARTLKIIATMVAVILAIFVIAACAYLFRNRDLLQSIQR